MASGRHIILLAEGRLGSFLPPPSSSSPPSFPFLSLTFLLLSFRSQSTSDVEPDTLRSSCPARSPTRSLLRSLSGPRTRSTLSEFTCSQRLSMRRSLEVRLSHPSSCYISPKETSSLTSSSSFFFFVRSFVSSSPSRSAQHQAHHSLYRSVRLPWPSR